MKKQKDTALALLSGGLDSSIAAAMAKAQGVTLKLAVTFDYNQRAAAPEQKSAKKIADWLGAEHRIISLPIFRTFPTSGLLSGTDALPRPTKNELNDAAFTAKSADAVWVPNRNGVFLEVAAALAESLSVSRIIVGFNKEEAATFPDNTLEYLDAVNKAFRFSTRGRVEAISPTISFNKTQIVAEAKRLEFPLELLWSCYEASSTMCGRCESCMRLKRAFSENGVKLNGIFSDISL
jgi:7-cyano-7-deazaguanine synthase